MTIAMRPAHESRKESAPRPTGAPSPIVAGSPTTFGRPLMSAPQHDTETIDRILAVRDLLSEYSGGYLTPSAVGLRHLSGVLYAAVKHQERADAQRRGVAA